MAVKNRFKSRYQFTIGITGEFKHFRANMIWGHFEGAKVRETKTNLSLAVDDEHHLFHGAISLAHFTEFVVCGPLRESKAAQHARPRRVLPLVAGPAAIPSAENTKS